MSKYFLINKSRAILGEWDELPEAESLKEIVVKYGGTVEDVTLYSVAEELYLENVLTVVSKETKASK